MIGPNDKHIASAFLERISPFFLCDLCIFRKIFVGGIAYDVINEDLTNHFQQFGEVAQAQVKFDRVTGRSRGFAFVEFATGEGCKAALAAREQTIKNKQV